jgi:Pro-kumamolisin, activation domain/Bacterial Ig-like domain (group 3)
MRPSPSSVLRSLCLFHLLVLVRTIAIGQQAAVAPQVSQAVDEAQLTVLRGNTHPLATAKFDRGAAPSALPLQRMLLVLKRSAEQETALRQLLDEQQDKASPNYHKWVTPEEFGKRFGPADPDIQAVTSWLQSHGFQIAQVSKGRTVIEFSGTAAMVREALHTDIRQYVVNGEAHWANARDPQIPSALTPVVAGVWTLHNFLKKPNLVMSKERFPLADVPGSKKPLATSSTGHHYLSPGDYAVIYGINPVYQGGITGINVIIGVVGRSDISTGDIFDFRNVFGMQSPGFGIIASGPDPGDLGGGEEAEAVLDTTWSGAVAPGAYVQLVISATTDTTDGVDLSELYIVDNNLADVMTESFGVCENNVTCAQLAGFSALAEQAAAQGITYVVSSGDTGSAGCDDLSETTAHGPVAVNALAATPFNVAVGGTIFNEGGHESKYWSASTTQAVTALSYIPENVWNESCVSCSSPNIAAGGGGASQFVSKPFWQAGVSGIPNDTFRDLPDVSLTAALHDPYLICLAGSCSQQGFLAGIGGTSASTPSFAGMMALVVQKVGSRVGAANYVLYRLAASQTFSQCNGSSTSGSPASTCVFNDVTSGNNAVPGEASYGTSTPKYASGPAYDLTTGLGSIRVHNLVNSWTSVTYSPTTTTLALNPTSNIVHGSSVNATVAVAPTSGTAKPTGNVSLIASFGQQTQGFTVLPLTAGTAVDVTHALPGNAGTQYNVIAHYAGDATFAPSDSSPVAVTVSAEDSTTTVSAQTVDNTNHPIPLTSVPYGTFAYIRADVAGKSGYGFPSGSVNFWDNGAGNAVEGDPYSLNSQGNTAAPYGLFRFAPGNHSVTAAYVGDASFNASTSAPVTFSITKATPAPALTVSPLTGLTPNTNVTLSVKIKTNSGGLAPEGSVTFFSGTTNLGSGAIFGETPGGPLSDGTIFLAYSQATLSTQFPLGQDSITAQYSGDPNYLATTSSAVSVNVVPDFTVTSTSNTVNISAPGGSGALPITITGGTGYNSTITFSATSCSGLPAGVTCNFNPATVAGNGTTTLMITTTAAHLRGVGQTMALNGWIGGGLTLAGVFLVSLPVQRRRGWRLLALLTVVGLMTLVACGGSGGGGGTSGTPVGSYAGTVTANTGSLTRTLSFTLNVQ